MSHPTDQPKGVTIELEGGMEGNMRIFLPKITDEMKAEIQPLLLGANLNPDLNLTAKYENLPNGLRIPQFIIGKMKFSPQEGMMGLLDGKTLNEYWMSAWQILVTGLEKMVGENRRTEVPLIVEGTNAKLNDVLS